jgi:hypothetical protein
MKFVKSKKKCEKYRKVNLHFADKLNATELTQWECPRNGPETTSPVSASHTRIVLSQEPDTMRVPSGENATEMTESECP